jgi:hypothetical protein
MSDNFGASLPMAGLLPIVLRRFRLKRAANKHTSLTAS